MAKVLFHERVALYILADDQLKEWARYSLRYHDRKPDAAVDMLEKLRTNRRVITLDGKTTTKSAMLRALRVVDSRSEWGFFRAGTRWL